jgi:hypothetical protein
LRLLKLKERVELDKGPEAENARRILNRLLSKYSLYEEDVDTAIRSDHDLKTSNQMRDTTIYLAQALDIEIGVYKKSRRLYIHATAVELDVFMTCFTPLKRLFNERYRKAMLELKSYMFGFTQHSYPKKPPTCTRCLETLIERDKTYVCPKCDYVLKSKRVDVDFENYSTGIRDSGVMITDRTST